nr:hypothetical protein GCM10017745_50650 [Saccharothrix mutabilis subsp. capreolus]
MCHPSDNAIWLRANNRFASPLATMSPSALTRPSPWSSGRLPGAEPTNRSDGAASEVISRVERWPAGGQGITR